MRLTKDVRRQLLEQNEGFSTKTSYRGRNSSEDRTYTITGGQLHIHASGKTSWADSRYTSDGVADEDQTHRYLYDHLHMLDKDGIDQTAGGSQKRARAASSPAHRSAEEDSTEDEYDNMPLVGHADAPASGLRDGLVVAATLALAVYVLGKPLWDERVKPAIDRRRARREQRDVSAAPAQEGANTSNGIAPKDD